MGTTMVEVRSAAANAQLYSSIPPNAAMTTGRAVATMSWLKDVIRVPRRRPTKMGASWDRVSVIMRTRRSCPLSRVDGRCCGLAEGPQVRHDFASEQLHVFYREIVREAAELEQRDEDAEAHLFLEGLQTLADRLG